MLQTESCAGTGVLCSVLRKRRLETAIFREWVSLSEVQPLALERSPSHLRRKLSRHRRSSIVAQLARVATDELPVNASRPDAGVPEPASHPVSMSMRLSHSLKESLAADFLDRYAHFFDAYIHVRGAWLALPLMLVQQ